MAKKTPKRFKISQILRQTSGDVKLIFEGKNDDQIITAKRKEDLDLKVGDTYSKFDKPKADQLYQREVDVTKREEAVNEREEKVLAREEAVAEKEKDKK